MTFASALCAGANVNLKEKQLAIYGKGYNDSLKFRKIRKNTKKTTTFAHLVIIVILFELNVKWYYS